MESPTGSQFDSYSESYSSLLDDSVKITGYEGDYFLRCKLEKLRALFGEKLAGPFNFLDFGCGPGQMLQYFPEYFPNALYTGVDASSEMIVQAKKKSACNFFQLEEKGWKEKSYDLILAANVFHHIPPEQHHHHLKELLDALTPEGRLVVWEHNPLNPVTQKIVKDCEFDRDAILIPARKLKSRLKRLTSLPVKILYTGFFPKFLSRLSPLESKMEWLPIGAQYLAIAKAPQGK